MLGGSPAWWLAVVLLLYLTGLLRGRSVLLGVSRHRPGVAHVAHAVADGAVVTQARVPWRAQSTRDTGFTEVNANGDQVHVGVHEPGGITLHAYDADTLRPLWTAPGVPPGGIRGFS